MTKALDQEQPPEVRQRGRFERKLQCLQAFTHIGNVRKELSVSEPITPQDVRFLAQAQTLAAKTPDLQRALANARSMGDAAATDAAQRALQTNNTLRFNNGLDAVVAGIFLVLVSAIIFLSVREWLLLLSKRKPAVLHETEPVWLSDYALKETGPNLSTAAGAAAITLALARELSGESHLERAHQQAQAVCECHPASTQQIYVEVTEQRFNGVRRCC